MAEQAVVATLAVESLSVITYQQRPVITTELLAQAYGTDADNIRHNFSRNARRFVEGKHFFKLEGPALREFKKALHDRESCSGIARQTRNLLLWTERGAARHAKMLDTDQAWDVFERLEDSYFNRAERTAYTVGPRDTLTAEQADELRDMLTDAAEQLPEGERGNFMRAGWGKLKAHFKVPYRHIPAHEFTEAVSLVARHVAAHQPEPAPLALPDEQILLTRLPDGNYSAQRIGIDATIVEMRDIRRLSKLVELVADFAPRECLPELVRIARRRLAS